MAFTFENSAEVAGSTSNPVTDTLTVTSTAEVFVVTITTTGGSARTGGAPTFGGVEMLQAGNVESSTEGKVELWFLLNDDIDHGLGASLSVPNSGTAEISVVSSWYGLTAGNSALFYDTAQDSGTSTAPLVSVTAPLTQCVVVDGLFSGINSLFGVSSDQTLHEDGDTGNEIYAGSHFTGTTVGTVNMGYSLPSSDDWAIIGASFIEVSDPDLEIIDGLNYLSGYVDSRDTINANVIGEVDGLTTNL